MAQWMHMTQMLQHLPYETVSSLYPPNSFPIEVRHYISEWIENQRWYDAHTYCTCTCLFILNKYCMCLFIRDCVCVCVCSHREDFSQEKIEQESQAQTLLDQGISMLQSVAQQNANVVEKMKLMQMSRNMVIKPKKLSISLKRKWHFILVFGLYHHP